MQYQWIATYKDGSELCQYKEDGTENRYGDIVRNNLVAFSLLTLGEQKDYPILCLHVDDGCRLIYRRRVEQWGNGENDKRVVQIVGLQRKTSRGVVSECISVLFEDGHIEQAPTWKEGTRWFYPPGENIDGKFVPGIHAHEGEEWDFA